MNRKVFTHSLKFPIWLSIGSTLVTSPLWADALPLRAAYEFASGVAWSADVEVPKYDIIDLGKDVTPLAVSDGGVVLAYHTDDKLIRWKWGQTDTLLENFPEEGTAHLNEVNTVVAQEAGLELEPIIRIWDPQQTSGTILDFGNSMITEPHYAETYALNDMDELALMSEADLFLYFPPPNPLHIETNIVSLADATWTELSQYEYYNSQDFVLTQGGKEYIVYDLNNYGDTVGYVYEDQATSSTWDPEPTYTYQNEFFSLNGDTSLDFEPLQINDHRTILGRTSGPLYGMVILDSFGQRNLGPILAELEDSIPQMSNPANAFEEIVLGERYWKRMTERDQNGFSTSTPSPDFWEGVLLDLIHDPGLWRNLQATCISANGRIAGTAQFINPETLIIESRGFMLAASPLVPDWNRDGTIDTIDADYGTRQLPWRFWVNDDDDEGELAQSWEDDFPGSDSPDWENPDIDGLRDAVDFFPLHLDLQKILQGIGDLSDVDLVLRHPGESFNFVYTDLHPGEVGKVYADQLTAGFGPDFTDSLASARTQQLTTNGVVLSAAFLSNIQSENKGVLLLEAREPTLQPITLELRKQGAVILESSLEVSISPVSDMFRIINLRNADPKFASADPGPWPTRTVNPPNLPDQYLRQFSEPLRTLVHIHGYNWTGEQVPAAHSELFKRFYQSGSQARFVGVSWRGDEGTLALTDSSIEYNENVINAFVTAKYATDALAPFSGPHTSVFAHSLGNMVASSAITDFGLQVSNFFMVNAAVPREAYMGETAGRRLMVHPDWKGSLNSANDYPEHLLSPNWYRLFNDTDNRSLLKWKGRFEDINSNTVCINYYSSGEEILAEGDGELPGLFSDVLDQEQIWVYNEMIKGVSTTTAYLTSEVHGGWGFNSHYLEWIDIGGPLFPPAGYFAKLSPEDAGNIPPADLIAEPFFGRFSDGDSDFPAWGIGDWLYGTTLAANTYLPALPFINASMSLIKNHAKIIAEAIPAHSAPAGCLSLMSLPLLNNIDLNAIMMNRAFWPVRDDSEKNDRWLHGDYREPALSHVSKFYKHCIEALIRIP